MIIWTPHTVDGTVNARWIIKTPAFIESSRGNIVEISAAFSWSEHCITSTNYQCHVDSPEVCFSNLQELKELSRVSCSLYFGKPEYSRGHKLKSVGVTSSDIAIAFVLLDAVFIVLPVEDIMWLIYVSSLTLLRAEREQYNSCNTVIVDNANNATRFILRFIKF